jgi:hypothetical protein
LNAIQNRFPDLEIVALVRDERKAEKVSQRGRHLRTIIGDFTDLDIIEGQAKVSDVVISRSHNV